MITLGVAPCHRCARSVEVILRGLVLGVAEHDCDRYLAYELIDSASGALLARWTSDEPGRTGPLTLAGSHAGKAGTVASGPLGCSVVYDWVSG